MGQETETRNPTSGNDSGASDRAETKCAKCDAVHRCVCCDAAKHSCGYTSASHEGLQCSSSSDRPGPVCSDGNANPSSASSARSRGRFQCSFGLKRGRWKLENVPPGKMPLGRLIGTGDLRDVAERGLAGERVYLKDVCCEFF